MTCWLLPEVLLVVLEEPEAERVACWLELPEVLLVEEAEEPEVERLTCWLLEELERDTEEAELERVAEEELDRETEEPELERVAWVEDDLVPLEERVWAIISGAATRDRAISTVAAIVIKRLIASKS